MFQFLSVLVVALGIFFGAGSYFGLFDELLFSDRSHASIVREPPAIQPAQQIQPIAPAPQKAASQTSVGFVTASRLNMRTKPAVSSEHIATLNRNTRLDVLEKGDKWIEVRDPGSGQTGWVYGKYLRIE